MGHHPRDGSGYCFHSHGCQREVPQGQRSNGATHGKVGTGNHPNRGYVVERYRALLLPYRGFFFADDLDVHMFQYGNYTLITPAHTDV